MLIIIVAVNQKERLDKEEMRGRLDKKNEELRQLREELTLLHSQKHERLIVIFWWLYHNLA